MQHFHDGQIRRYITQIIRLMSNFSYKDGDGDTKQVPVMYGDITRQVGSILRDNSENKIPSAPRMAVYVTGLEMDTARLADSSYVNKVNIRERAYDDAGQEYLNEQGKNYTVERLMPTPYNLSVNVDIWTTNTDQKLQIMEQILVLFNPSLEIQTTDNYIDWTSLSVVNLEQVTWSSRSIPMGTESEIDVATMGFKTPVFISPPVKVKRLGVVTNIINSIFSEEGAVEVDFGSSNYAEANIRTRVAVTRTGEIENIQENKQLQTDISDIVISNSHNKPDLLVMGNSARLIVKGVVNGETWTGWLKAIPEQFLEGVTELRLNRNDLDNEVVGTVAINPTDEYDLTVTWDDDTLPTDTVITSSLGDRSKIDYIIDPIKSNPQELGLTGNPRILLLGPIGDADNEDGADAWKNLDGTDFVASENDIVEWDGARWTVVFDADTDTSIYGTVYTTNLNTGTQYKFDSGEWILAVDGEYPNGSWRLSY